MTADNSAVSGGKVVAWLVRFWGVSGSCARAFTNKSNAEDFIARRPMIPREAEPLVLKSDYAAAIARAEAAERDAARWRMCNGEHPLGDGEVAKVHVNVGVNVWKGEEWLSFEECSPEELEAVLAAIAAQQAGGGEHARD